MVNMAEETEEYEWSSYKFYIGNQKHAQWLYRDFILDYFGRKEAGAKKQYQSYVHAFVTRKYDSPLDEVVSSADRCDQTVLLTVFRRSADRSGKNVSVANWWGLTEAGI